MKKPFERGIMTLLMLCAVVSAFYLRAENDQAQTAIPVERVFSQAAQPEKSARQRRDDQRDSEMRALSALAAEDEAAAKALRQLVERAENERTVEDALSALGYAGALCELRREAAVICVSGALNARDAQRVAEVCAALAGISPENVLVLDECAYL